MVRGKLAVFCSLGSNGDVQRFQCQKLQIYVEVRVSVTKQNRYKESGQDSKVIAPRPHMPNPGEYVFDRSCCVPVLASPACQPQPVIVVGQALAQSPAASKRYFAAGPRRRGGAKEGTVASGELMLPDHLRL